MTHRFKNRKNSDGIKLFQARPVFISETGGEVISGIGADIEKREDEEKEQLPVQPGEGVPINADEKEKKENEKESGPDEAIPERPAEAMTGTQFAEHLKKLEAQTAEKMRIEGKSSNEIANEKYRVRERAVYEQIISGNIPKKMSEFKDVEVSMTDKNGKKVEGTIKVMPDYLMIGSDEDAIRVPMSPATAQLIARQFNCTLPTDKMVDAIAAQARRNGVSLQPTPKPDQSRFMQTQYFIEHEMQIREQMKGVSGNPLVAGDKKDIVLPYGADGTKHVVIYGWHQKNGSPIQPYSGPHHEWSYMDYSHGVRLVSRTMTIRHSDGRVEQKNISDVLGDRDLYKLISKAPIKNSAYAYKHPGVVKEIDISSLPRTAKSAESEESQTASAATPEIVNPTISVPDSVAENTPPQPQPPTSASEQQAATQPAETQAPSPSPSGGGYQAAPSPAPASPSYESSQPASTTGGSTPETSPAPYQQPQSQAESAPQHAEVQNKNKVIVLGDSLSEGAGPKLELGNVTPRWKSGRYASTMRQIFESMPESKCRGGTLYVLGGSNDLFDKNRSVEAITADLQKIYTLAKARGMKVIAATPPPLGNSTYLGQTPSHVQNEAELRNKWDALNNWILGREGSKDSSGNPDGPDKVLRFHEIFADPADKYILRDTYRSADGVHMTPTAYTLMAGHVRDATLQLEPQDTNTSPAPSESVPATGPQAHVFQKAENPREFVKKNNVPPINGPTAFFGSSSIAGISRVPYLKNGGHQYHAKNGLTAGELQNMANTASDSMKNFKNAVVLIGTNDIGANKSADLIFGEIEAIWNTILRGNPDINLHVCTLPPFGNYVGYSKNKTEIDNKRLAVNKKIREAAQKNPKLKLIDLCLPVEKGGLTAPDGDSLDPSVSYKQDPLHTESNALAMVFGRAINSSS